MSALPIWIKRSAVRLAAKLSPGYYSRRTYMERDGARLPTMSDSLRVLLERGVQVNTVLDVGILTGTEPLIRVLNNVPHQLFEPVDLHFPKIAENYRNIEHKIHQVALSDRDGSAYLACRSIHIDGRITHAEVVERPVTASDVDGFVSCVEIPMTRLDTIVGKEAPEAPYLLKIDVDGHEMQVLRGARNTLPDVSIVVIEAPLNRTDQPHFFERSAFLMDHGFFLMDITELAYYAGILWQVDLVFVRRDLVEAIPELRPFEAENFRFARDHWYPLTERMFRT